MMVVVIDQSQLIYDEHFDWLLGTINTIGQCSAGSNGLVEIAQ